MGTVVYLGNHVAIAAGPEDPQTGQRARIPLEGKRCTTVQLPDGVSAAEAVTTLTHPQGVWAAHSDADAPAWVASTDPQLAQVLGALWGCEIRDPDPGV